MNNLREIRNRLRTVENIKKITDAMERVAAARLKRAQAQAEHARPYVTKMKEILERLAASVEVDHPLFQQRAVKKTALIVIAADRGLSGSYNSHVMEAADKFLGKYRKGEIDLILFGRKAVNYYAHKEWPIVYKKQQWGGKIGLHEIQRLSGQFVDWFLEEKYDEIWLLYTHYITLMNRKVVVEKFLNIGKPKSEQKPINYIFEPNSEVICTELLPRYCVTRLQTALFESYASELAARIVAMQTASKNSKKMIHDLTLIRNKVRQEGITKEIIEISSSGKV